MGNERLVASDVEFVVSAATALATRTGANGSHGEAVVSSKAT